MKDIEFESYPFVTLSGIRQESPGIQGEILVTEYLHGLEVSTHRLLIRFKGGNQ